jgi:hypothetical protein
VTATCPLPVAALRVTRAKISDLADADNHRESPAALPPWTRSCLLPCWWRRRAYQSQRAISSRPASRPQSRPISSSRHVRSAVQAPMRRCSDSGEAVGGRRRACTLLLRPAGGRGPPAERKTPRIKKQDAGAPTRTRQESSAVTDWACQWTVDEAPPPLAVVYVRGYPLRLSLGRLSAPSTTHRASGLGCFGFSATLFRRTDSRVVVCGCRVVGRPSALGADVR